MNVLAPRSGHITKILVGVGDPIDLGQPLALSELMKMITEIPAPAGGKISAIHVAENDVIEEGQLLFEYDAAHVDEEREAPSREGVGTKDLTKELDQRRHALSDAGRAERIAKRHQQKGRSARENVADLFDPGSLNELGGHVLAAQRASHDPDALIERSSADGVITATGTIGGVPAAAMIVDYTVMAGTQGFFHHKKIDRLLDVVSQRNLPLILYPEGGGGRPNDVDAFKIAVAQLEIMTFKNLARLKGTVPIVAVVHGYCFAGSAALAAMADIIIATQAASIGMGGPAMIEGGGLGVFHPSEVGPAAMLLERGVVDVVCADEKEATQIAKCVTAWLSGNQENAVDPPDHSDLDAQLLPKDRKTVFDVRAVIGKIFDDDTFLELKSGFAPNLIAGLAWLDGKPCGVLANFSGHMAGAVDGLASQKASFLFELCQARNLPMVSLIDTPGFMVGPEAEKTGQIAPIGQFFTVGARFDPPLIAVVMRRAYGLGAMAMAGGSLHAADTTLSWPSGEFGAMGIEGAVRLGNRDALAAIEDETARREAFEAMVEALYEKGKALNAAAFFEIDDVIKPSETRARLIAVLNSIRDREG